MKELVPSLETVTDIETRMVRFLNGLGFPKFKIVCRPRLVYFYQHSNRKDVWTMLIKKNKRETLNVIHYIDCGVMAIELGAFDFQTIPLGTVILGGQVGMRYNENGVAEQVLYCKRPQKKSVPIDYYGMEADSEEAKVMAAENLL